MEDLNLDNNEQPEMDKENTAFSTEDSEEVKTGDSEQKVDEQEQKGTEKAVEASKKLDELIETEDDEPKEKESTEKTGKSSEEKSATDKKPEDKKTGDDKSSTEKEAGEEKDAAGKTETKTKEEQKTDEGKSTIGDGLLERAVRNGLSLDDAKSFGNPEALARTLTILEESRSAAGEQTEGRKTGKDTETTQEIKFEPLEIKFDNEADLDPEVVKQIKAINEHNSKAFESMSKFTNDLGKQLTITQQAIANQADQKVSDRIESMFGELGDDYKDLVGTGRGETLDENSNQFTNRVSIINAMKAIDQVAFDSKQRMKPLDKVFKQAVKQVFSDKQAEITNKKVAKSVTDRNKQAINNPTGSRKATVTGDEAAIQTSKEFDEKVSDSDD